MAPVFEKICSCYQAAIAVKPRPNLATQKHIPKPQLSFEHVPKNKETGGFRPLMSSKPHAKIPLEVCLKTFKDSNGREQYAYCSDIRKA